MQTARSLQPKFAVIARMPGSHSAASLRRTTLLRVESRELAQARARRDFERAVLPCQPALRASALRLARSRADADDLVQETLLRAWRFWPSYREQDHCRAWLQRIMTNTFCSTCRSATRRRTQLSELAVMQAQAETVTATDEVPDVVLAREPASDTGLSSDVRLASSFAALKPEQRRILSLIDVNERSYREAAQELACPIGTVMSRLHRARRALRLQLAAAP